MYSAKIVCAINMKKSILDIFLLLLLVVACSTARKDYSYLYTKESNYDVSGAKVSPFLGKWELLGGENPGDCIIASIGERNDSLMVSLSYVLNYGRFLDPGGRDANGKTIPDICILLPKSGNTVKGVYSPECSRLKYAPFASFSIRLIDKNTMVMSTGKGEHSHFTPDTAAYKRVDNQNCEFSHRLDHVYVDSVVIAK